MIRNCYCSLAALVMCTSAYAGVMWTSSIVNPPFTTETTLTGHKGYVIGVMTDDGSNISAVDINIRGQLHQRWVFNADTEEFDPTPSSANITNGDSHLTPVAGALIGSALIENNNITPSPLADTATRDYGYGDSLRGAWGIPGPSQTNKANLAYIVVRETEIPNIQVRALVATPNGTFLLTESFSPLPLGILTSNPVPGPGIEIDFGNLPPDQNPAPLPIALSNAGSVETTISVLSISLAGPNAANFVFTGTLPTVLVGGAAPQSFGVDFVPQGPLASQYTAQVLVVTNAGNLAFDVVAYTPEPATLALAGLAVVGLVGLVRRK